MNIMCRSDDRNYIVVLVLLRMHCGGVMTEITLGWSDE